MKNFRQTALIITAAILLAGTVIVCVLKSVELSPSSVSAAAAQAKPVEPATPPPPAGQEQNAQTNAGQPVVVQGGADDGEPTPEFVTEPVPEPDADEQAIAPSAETVQAIREIRKPAEGEGQITEYPDGAVGINLGNRYRSVPVAVVGKDGKVLVDYHGEKYLKEGDHQAVQKNNAQKQDEQKQEVKKP